MNFGSKNILTCVHHRSPPVPANRPTIGRYLDLQSHIRYAKRLVAISGLSRRRTAAMHGQRWVQSI